MIKYNFSEEFTRYPGPRFRRLGKNSGEEFRENILRPIFENDDIIDIDTTGVLSFSPSFLDEAFSPLADEYGLDTFKEKIILHSQDDAIINKKMMSYVLRYLDRRD